MPRVLVTDYAWPSLDIERGILGEVGAELVVAETGEPDELVALADGCDAILTNWKRVPPEALDAAPRLPRRLALRGRPRQHPGRPRDRARDPRRQRARLLPARGLGPRDGAAARLRPADRRVRALDARRATGALDLGPGLPRLAGQTLGLVGFGNIARALVPKARGFGMRVLACDAAAQRRTRRGDVEVARDLEQLLAESDYVSLHAPATPRDDGPDRRARSCAR